MAKKNDYPIEFKERAVRMYLDGEGSYQELSERLGLKSNTQLKNWVRKALAGESLEDGRGKALYATRKGRPKTTFTSPEEELAYVKAELEYVKKLYRSRFGHEWGAHKKEFFSK